MSRSKRMEWKNGRYQPKWTVRILWYDDGPNDNLGGDIKLRLLDCEKQLDIYPKDLDAAEQIWEMFKQAAPKESVRTPIVDIVIELSKKFGLIK